MKPATVVSPGAAAVDPRLRGVVAQLGGLVGRVRVNRNERTLLSLRGSRHEGLRLSLHEGLLDHPAALAELPAWVAARGGPPGPALRSAIDRVFGSLAAARRADPAQVPIFAPLGGPVDLPALYDEVHRQWFPHLPRPVIAWGPRRSKTPRRRIRFAAYIRRPEPRIVVNRCLDQPWVAREFVTYVLYHELCHHAQACAPLRGETAHSPRFKAWESRYPRFTELLRWEKAHLDRFLAGAAAGSV